MDNGHLVVGVVLGFETNRISLIAQIRVLGDQHHLWRLAEALRTHLFHRHSQDVVVPPPTHNSGGNWARVVLLPSLSMACYSLRIVAVGLKVPRIRIGLNA